MSTALKLQAGSTMPIISLPKAGGGGDLTIGGTGHWQMVVVYRGKHCPLCKKYLKTLNESLEELKAMETSLIVASADSREKAESEADEEGWTFPVAYGLTVEQMRMLGAYISTPRSEQETDRPFAEPCLFIVNPEGKVQIVDISNAPFSRPEIAGIINGLKLIREKNYPVRGMMA